MATHLWLAFVILTTPGGDMKYIRLAIVTALLLLSSCATFEPAQQGMDYMAANQNQLAYNTFVQCANTGNPACWNNLGVMYQQGRIGNGPDLNAAISHYTMAARYGLPIAQQNLAALGAPVPPADLAAIQMQQQAQANQTAGQLGSLLGCALAGGNCNPSYPVQQTRQSAPMSQSCQWDHQCGVKGFCLKQAGAEYGVCVAR